MQVQGQEERFISRTWYAGFLIFETSEATNELIGPDLMTDFETQMDNRDARELHRREVVKKSIERLPPQLTEQAWMKEMQDVDAYEALKSSILSSSREQALPGRGDLAVTSGQNPLLNLE